MESLFSLHGYGPSIMEGALLTIEIAVVSLIISILLGVMGALFKLSKSAILQKIALVYTTIIRGIPDLVLMLIIYFGGQVFVNQMAPKLGYEDYIDVNPFIAGVLTIGFIFGAYMTETIRGAILAVPAGQLEAARAYGLRPSQVFFRVLLPQMIRHAIPGFGNNWLVLVKATALVSIIGLEDMVRKAGLAAGSTRKPFTFFVLVAVIFLIITSISTFILSRLENRYSAGVKKA